MFGRRVELRKQLLVHVSSGRGEKVNGYSSHGSLLIAVWHPPRWFSIGMSEDRLNHGEFGSENKGRRATLCVLVPVTVSFRTTLTVPWLSWHHPNL
jgi:hypothetical protein